MPSACHSVCGCREPCGGDRPPCHGSLWRDGAPHFSDFLLPPSGFRTVTLRLSFGVFQFSIWILSQTQNNSKGIGLNTVTPFTELKVLHSCRSPVLSEPVQSVEGFPASCQLAHHRSVPQFSVCSRVRTYIGRARPAPVSWRLAPAVVSHAALSGGAGAVCGCSGPLAASTL